MARGGGIRRPLEAEGKAELGFLERHVGGGQACVTEEGCGGRGAPHWENAPNGQGERLVE